MHEGADRKKTVQAPVIRDYLEKRIRVRDIIKLNPLNYSCCSLSVFSAEIME